MTFRDFYKGKIGTDKRHMHAVGRDASSHSKHPGRFVPHMHRTKHNNQKVQSLLNKPSGKYTLNIKELAQIEGEFHFKFDRDKPKKLGNTGVEVRYDAILQRPVIEKK